MDESPSLFLAESPSPPNTSAPSSTRKRVSREKLAKDYPSFVIHKKNPLSKSCARTNKRGEALRKLGIVEADLERVPKITPRVREAVGSVKEAVAILEGDDSPDSVQFMSKYNMLTGLEQKAVHLEDVIVAANLTGRRFMELLAGASFDHSATVSKIFVSRSQLKVLQSTVKAATDEVPITAYNAENGTTEVVGHSNGDVKAMEIFHKITGALPTPKGSNFTFNQQIKTAAPEDTQSPVEARPPLQTMDSWLLEIDDIRKPKQLSATVPVIPVEMPENAPEVEYLDLGD